ncbi:hypothetical protein HZ994_15165 [Akkermansiaceae bacterium]|nr:hypothetical protein HZ994_15165 [Akkermansiaceae bacterium]
MEPRTSTNRKSPFPRSGATLLLCMLAASIPATAFAEKKPRNFFAPKGIVVGTPAVAGDGELRIPIKFETDIVHSALMNKKVHVSVKGNEIHITADYGLIGKKSYPGYIPAKGLARGTYELRYRDPDGKLHPIGSVTLP